MHLLFGIATGLTVTVIAGLWGLGASRKRRWSRLAELENAPYESAVSVAYSGPSGQLVRGLVSNRVRLKSSYNLALLHDIQKHVMEILTASKATRDVMIETQRLYKEAAEKRWFVASFYGHKLSRKLATLQSIGRYKAGLERPFDWHQLGAMDFAAIFKDETFNRILIENGLRK